MKGNLHSTSSIKGEPAGNHAISSEPIENRLQQPFQVFHDTIAEVLDDVFSQTPSPLATCEIQTSIDTSLIRKPVSLSFSAGVSSQSSYESLHSWYEEKESNILDEISPSAHEFQNPYAVLLEADRESILLNLGKFGSIYKFSWELPFNSYLSLFIRKHLRRIQTTAGILTWLH